MYSNLKKKKAHMQTVEQVCPREPPVASTVSRAPISRAESRRDGRSRYCVRSLPCLSDPLLLLSITVPIANHTICADEEKRPGREMSLSDGVRQPVQRHNWRGGPV